GGPVLSNNIFSNNYGAALSMNLSSSPDLTGVSLINNGINGVALDGGTLATDTSWNNPIIVYQIQGTVTVPSGKQLTIAAGQVIKTASGDPLITVQGTLVGNGTAAAPIIFTSARDDSAGGDTNNNGSTSGGNGEWNRIEFKDG